jgi:hypothetical protein
MRTLLIIILLNTQCLLSQIKIRPIVEAGYGFNLIPQIAFSNVLHAGAGVKLNERFYFQLNFIQTKEINKFNYDYYYNQVFTFSTACRFFGNKLGVSPNVSLEIGDEFYSNARGRVIKNFTIYADEDYPGEPAKLYDRGKLFLKAKLQADFKYKDFDFLIGVGYTYFLYERYDLKLKFNTNKGGFIILDKELAGYAGPSLEASLRYTLDFGKNKEK